MLRVRPPVLRVCVCAVDRRCQEIMRQNQAFVCSLQSTLSSEMIKLPKTIRGMRAEDLLGIAAADIENVRPNADAILMSAKRPTRPPLAPRQFETPVAASKMGYCAPGSVRASAGVADDEVDPTSKLLMTALVCKVREIAKGRYVWLRAWLCWCARVAVVVRDWKECGEEREL